MSQIFSDVYDELETQDRVSPNPTHTAVCLVQLGYTWLVAGDENGPNIIVLVKPYSGSGLLDVRFFATQNSSLDIGEKVIEYLEKTYEFRKLSTCAVMQSWSQGLTGALGGMREIGVAKKHALIRDHFVDMVLYERFSGEIEPEILAVEEIDLGSVPDKLGSEPAEPQAVADPVVSEPVTQSEGPTIFGDNAEDPEREKRLIRVFG